MFSPACRYLHILAVCVLLTACESTAYYAQAVGGHAGIMIKRQPIERILDSDDATPELKAQLTKILELRVFAGSSLYLPWEDQYDTYVQLDSDYAVWNIFAAPELSLEPRTWCYPVVGCAGYRGYYDRVDANAYGEQLRGDGYDVYIGGVAAYSTLGWFNDPVLSTFIKLPESALASLLFHEMAHQLLFVEGDTMFNESFATVVAREGVRRWLSDRNDNEAWQRFLEDQQQMQQFLDLVSTHRDSLEKIYASEVANEEKHISKAEIIANLKDSHEALKQDWGGTSPYDAWFAQDINNAQLNAVAAYFDLAPAFESLLQQQGGDLQAFYTESRRLAELDRETREARLDDLIQR